MGIGLRFGQDWEEGRGETYHGIPTSSWFWTVIKLAKTPRIVADPMSIISSQKLSWMAGQRYLRVRCITRTSVPLMVDEVAVVATILLELRLDGGLV